MDSNDNYHSNNYENPVDVEEFDHNFDADEDDDDEDFPSLCDISFDGHEDDDEEEEEEADNECDDELGGGVDCSEDLSRMKEKDEFSIDGTTGRRSSSLSSGVSSLCDSYSYPIYLRPDILDLLNERARQSP